MNKITKIKTSGLLAFASVAFFFQPAEAKAHNHGGESSDEEVREHYKIDPVHSSVDFRVRHFVNRVSGRFGEFSGDLHIDRENLENSSAEVIIQVASIDTNNSDRDDHLRSDDFFDAENYGEITFVSTSWEDQGEDRFHITGDLTIHGTTREVTLEAELLGFGEGRGDIYLTGWEASTQIDRTDYGVSYGTPAIGSTVDIIISVQAHLQD
ncbi:MAG: YceI family protein [Opitutales bacterium]|nr:YceI family protein [Opitutales bacterium]